MKKFPAVTAAILFGLGGVCNQAQSKFNVQLTPNNEQELYDAEKFSSYLYDLKNELRIISQLNSNKKLSSQDMFFLWYYTQKITEFEFLLAKYNAAKSNQILQKLQIAIQMKIDEIELLKGQAHYNFNKTNIVGL